MYRFALLMALGAALAGCGGLPDKGQSCAKLAETRAAELLDSEFAKLEELETGTPYRSDVRRQIIRLNVEAYRRQIYEDCQRARGLTQEEH